MTNKFRIIVGCLIILTSTSLTHAQEDRFVIRLTSFPNTEIIIDLKLVGGSPQINVDTASSCLTADCASKYNLAADLTTVNDRITDFVINNLIQSSTPKISGVCSFISNENSNLSFQSQRSFTFPAAAKHTGIASYNVYRDLVNKYHATYFKFTNDPALIAHATANVNSTNCNVTGPFKELYRIKDAEFQTSPKTPGFIVGAITKSSEGFEFYYANVLVPGSAGQTKLTIPGGNSVNVVSGYLLTDDSGGTSPGAAGISSSPAFLLYRVQKQQGSKTLSSILLQLLNQNNNTFTQMGGPKTISPFSETKTPGPEFVHSVALASNRQFVIFTSFSNACGKEVLKYQKINPNTGAKIGAPVELLECSDFSNSLFGAYAVDILALHD
jgi:hypothetical protein